MIDTEPDSVEDQTITIVCLNVGRGGGKLDPHAAIPAGVGEDPARWGRIVERLSAVTWPDGTVHKPAIIGLNELCGWDWARLRSAATDLGMAPVGVTPRPPGTPDWPAYPSGMLYDPAQFGNERRWNTDHSYGTHHGTGLATFTPGALGKPLGAVIAHLSPFSPEKAVAEAGIINYRSWRLGPYGIAMGDFNYLPLIGDSFDPADMTDYNWEHRFHLPDDWYAYPVTDAEIAAQAAARAAAITAAALAATQRSRPHQVVGQLRPRHEVARRLRGAGLYDAAAVMYRRTGNERHLAWTCPSMRIDWIMLTRPLLPALVDYQVLDRATPGDTEVSWVADHHAVAVRLDLTRADASNFQYH